MRARLTLTYTGLLLFIGATMVTLINVFMRYVPTYAISTPQRVDDPASGPSGPTGPTGPTGLDPNAAGSAQPWNDSTEVAIVDVTRSSPLTLRDRDDVLDTLFVVSIAVLLVIGVVGAWVGWLVAGRMLRPLQQLNAAAQRAGTGSLDHRVALRGPDDEFKDLSDTFDTMLERLDRSFRAHQRFAADASHELRTPLATSKAMLDVAADSLDDQDVPTLIARLQATNRRSIETVEALLDLSEIGRGPLSTGPVDLADVATEALPEVRQEAAEVDITLTTHVEKAPACGDAVLLRQLAMNLLQNALRHNHRGGSVAVTCGPAPRERGGAVLTVSNSGEVVPPETLALLTEPFFRGAGRSADRNGRQGHGLGLTLIAAIVEAHDGTLKLTAEQVGGLTATAWIPDAEANGTPG
ncbi:MULTISPECIES: sensor histidine kinase [Actinoalloteichus]|uniref:sensor histidine kinase n=1 Tax=Actinoalloteichus TaxID=65496 RepID=UPI000953036A|nr:MULTISPECIES: HAMP domain-containing sensor histidine kinase [Actinoalloteichus]